MSELLIIACADEHLGTEQHRVHLHCVCFRNADESVVLTNDGFLIFDIEHDATYIRLMERSYDFHNQRIAHFSGEGDSIAFLGDFHLLLTVDPCGIQECSDIIEAEVNLFTTVNDLTDSGHVHLRHFRSERLRFGGSQHIDQCVAKDALLGEVDAMFVFNEIGNLVLHIDDRRQNGENRLAAHFHFLVQHFVNLVIGEEAG